MQPAPASRSVVLYPPPLPPPHSQSLLPRPGICQQILPPPPTPSAGLSTRLVAQRDEPACTRAGSAVLVPFKRVLPRSSRSYITSCGLDSGGCQWVRHTHVRYDRTAGEQCQHRSPRSGSHGERGGSCCTARWPRAARGWAGVDGRAGGPGGHGQLSGGCGLASSGCWSGHSVDSSGGECGGGGSARVGGGCGHEGGARQQERFPTV